MRNILKNHFFLNSGDRGVGTRPSDTQSDCHIAASRVVPQEQQIVLTLSYGQSEGQRRALAQGVAIVFTHDLRFGLRVLFNTFSIILSFLFFLGFMCVSF